MNLREALLRLPKTDLHCHLDGSMRAETIMDIARKESVALGTDDLSELKKRLVSGRRVSTLETFLKAFKLTTPVMQTREGIERIAFELAEDAAAENVRYLEVRFTPIWCVQKGLSHREVMLAAESGLKKAEALYPIRTGLIICAIRIREPGLSMELAQLAVSLKNDGVVGFDLAHAEQGNPAKEHAEAFQFAKKNGLGITVHAGEAYGPGSISQAIKYCGAVRIGHGRTLCEDPALEQRVKELGIAIECCPSSNVQINLTPSFADHPVRGYVQRGLIATLNTDNRLLTGIRVTDEYVRCAEELHMTWEELKTTALNGFRAAFLPEDEKSALSRAAQDEMNRISLSS
ncbi:MAG: adenosine deaminase [Pseudomonadota bacterium]